MYKCFKSRFGEPIVCPYLIDTPSDQSLYRDQASCPSSQLCPRPGLRLRPRPKSSAPSLALSSALSDAPTSTLSQSPVPKPLLPEDPSLAPALLLPVPMCWYVP
ncbi:hypothetical protein COCON_G00127230 [Conger conger]|uniref:Uncharacterized protein n=1 Tax=Conger conger TaxID=82655 RepID=A0A9Q1HWS8_CONCO|nr:hypothetical protein COCON_G00127230 [Conger conger]